MGTIEFSWDESKRKWLAAKRGIDFLDLAEALFDGRPLLILPTPRKEEQRFLTIGMMRGKLFAVVGRIVEQKYD